MAVHFPGAAGESHAAHSLVQAPSQQNPSTQKPVAHWSAAVHVLVPAAFTTHTPEAQYASAAQSVSAAHDLVHAPLVQRKGSHWVLPVIVALQLPRPSQVC